ncbi:MAG: FAD-binding oxidoreductase [Negativicutes bacterium]|nr:FAD-binding oxidoreductase [Negativicutes bacterium]
MENCLLKDGSTSRNVTCLIVSNILEVQAAMQLAAKEGRQLYAYRSPVQDGIKLELSNLNRILEIDTANLIATVDPGVKINQLNAALLEKGLRFIPGDNPFFGEKTVGQFYHEGCSNVASSKYGFAKHFLMGSEIVVPNGELLKTGGKTVKNVTGYDFTRFMNGPYSDFGVTVKFLLKLSPRPEMKKKVGIEFPGFDGLCGFVDALREMRIVPAYLFWIDAKTRLMAGAENGSPNHLAVLELDGVSAEVDEQWGRVRLVLQSVRDASFDETGASVNLSDWRELFSPTHGFSLTDEFKFHSEDQRHFIERFYTVTQNRKIRAGLFGQIGVGKLHVYFDQNDIGKAQDLIQEIIGLAKEAGGYVSGKYSRLSGQFQTTPLVLLEQEMKKKFDPARIFGG